LTQGEQVIWLADCVELIVASDWRLINREKERRGSQIAKQRHDQGRISIYEAPLSKWSAEDLPVRLAELNLGLSLVCHLLRDREHLKNWRCGIDPLFINAAAPILYSSSFLVEKNVKFENSSARRASFIL
jgi:hypothetical protein